MCCLLEPRDFFQHQVWQREGERKRLLTEGKVFWKKIPLWFGRSTLSHCILLRNLNWIIPRPTPSFHSSFLSEDQVTERWWYMQRPQLSEGYYFLSAASSWSTADKVGVESLEPGSQKFGLTGGHTPSRGKAAPGFCVYEHEGLVEVRGTVPTVPLACLAR